VLCPSNPVASLGPILAVPGIRETVGARRTDVVGVSGIVAGAPLAGMADRLMPAAGAEVTAAGTAEYYRGLLGGWVVDDADRALIPRIEATRLRVGATDSIMTDDAKAEALARFALRLLG
jgi:LPPG:FO 2-phospho-L-lactate transferase